MASKMDRTSMDLEEVIDFLGSIPLLQQLPGESVRKVAEAIQRMDFDPGQEIVRGGEPGQGLYFIWKGQAEVYPPSHDGIVGKAPAILFPGDYFGFVCTDPSAERHKSDVIATTKVTCLVLSYNQADLLSAKSIWRKNLDQATLMERVLHLESLEVDLYRGIHSSDVFTTGQIYGGMLVGQALAAASKSVDPSLLVHHLHSQFLYIGDESLPVVYQVQRIRDGHTYAIRHVSATQKGQVIFTMLASFQRPEEGVEHQLQMPNAPAPEEVLSYEDIVQTYLGDPRTPPAFWKHLSTRSGKQIPLEIRYCEPLNVVNPKKSEARQRVWFRASERLSNDQALQRCAAAYGTDWAFLETALRPHSIQPGPRYRSLTLNHSLWFHTSFRADDWLLFVMESPRASSARALVLGHIYNQQGQLVASGSAGRCSANIKEIQALRKSLICNFMPLILQSFGAYMQPLLVKQIMKTLGMQYSCSSKNF